MFLFWKVQQIAFGIFTIISLPSKSGYCVFPFPSLLSLTNALKATKAF